MAQQYKLTPKMLQQAYKSAEKSGTLGVGFGGPAKSMKKGYTMTPKQKEARKRKTLSNAADKMMFSKRSK